MSTRQCLLAVVAVSASLAMVASGCTSSPEPAPTSSAAPVETAEPSGGVAASSINAAEVEPWAAGTVPGGDATGPTYPTEWPDAPVVGGGQTTSRTPTLIVPDDARLSGDVQVQIVDLGIGGGFGPDGRGEANGIAFEGRRSARGFTVPADTLVDGGTYAWRAGRTDDWAGPWVFTIDTVRSQNAPVDSVGNISVNLMSGVPAARWTSPEVSGALGAFGIGAIFRPGSPATPGLPEGWNWVLPGSGFISLQESEVMFGDAADVSLFGGDAGPLSVTLRTTNGAGLTFVRTETGGYVPGLSDGTATAYSRGGVLTRMSPNTWQLSTPDGSTTRFVDGHAVSEWSRGNPVADFTWDEQGRLVSVSDGISRTTALNYAGGSCPASGWGNGFDVADGMWCSATYADGTVTGVGYVGGRIGLIADPGGVGTGFGWDGAGRLAAVRSPGATAAAATAGSDWAGSDLTTSVAYDGVGRVASVTTAATAPGGERLTRTYTYPTGAPRDGDLQATVVQQGGPSAGNVLQVTATAERWLVTKRVEAGRLTTSTDYDRAGVATQGTDPQGRSITTKLDDEALMRTSTGPYTGSPDGALRTDRTLDATATDPDAGASSPTEQWHGLSAMVWSGDNGRAEWWDERTLEERGLSGAVGNDGEWEAQASGLWKVPESGAWTIQATASDDLRIEVIIDGVRCPEGDGCEIRLDKGEHNLAIALRGKGTGTFGVKAGRGGEPTRIPIDQVRPNFNTSTVVSLNDNVEGRNVGTQVYDFDRPWTQAPESVTASGGLRTAFSYEQESPASDQWGRQTSTKTAGGATMTTAYYGTDEQASGACGGGGVQGGLARQMTRYDGVTITMVYDGAGRVQSMVTSGDGASETTCLAYDAAGRTVSTSIADKAGATLRSSTYAYTWSDGRLTTQLTSTVAGESFTTSTTYDIAGRVLDFTDAWGTRTSYDYDVEGNNTKRTTTAPGGSSPILTVDLAHDGATGNVTRVDANGTTLAKVTYSDGGQPRSVDYPGSVSQSFDYNSAGAISVTQLTAKDTVFVQRRERNAAGRTLSSSTTVEQGSKSVTDATWGYDYDSAGRLIDAKLVTRGDASAMGGEKRTFGYAYGSQEQCPSSTGNDFNRTGGSRDGVDYVTCYDGRGRLAWTSDPHLAGEGGKAKATWDGLGRLVALDGSVPLALTWEAGTQASGVTQGDVASTMLTVGGVMIREDVGGAIRTLGYSGPGARLPSLVMDDAQKVTGMLVGLPGGAIAHLDPAGALERIDHPDLFLGVLASTDAKGAAPGLAAQYGPYGEPLVPATTASMEYGWQSTPRNPTLSGSHDLTFTARPYHPWLGSFLGFDPDVGVSPSGYGYGDGNPLDSPDPSGMSGALDIIALVFGIVATISGAASGVVARSSNGEAWETELKIIMVGSATISGIIAIARQTPLLREQAPQDGVTVASAVFAVLGVVAASVGAYRYSGQIEVGIKARQAIEEALERSAYSAAEDLAQDSLRFGKKAVTEDDYNVDDAFKRLD